MNNNKDCRVGQLIKSLKSVWVFRPQILVPFGPPKKRHVQRTTKMRTLCIDPPIPYQNILLLLLKRAGKSCDHIFSSIYFGVSAIAGSFGRQVSFTSTESELKIFTKNLYHTQFSRTIQFFVPHVVCSPRLLLLSNVLVLPNGFGPPTMVAAGFDNK